MLTSLLYLGIVSIVSGYWIPDDWKVAQARGDLLPAAAGAAGAQIGNGYVGAWVSEKRE